MKDLAHKRRMRWRGIIYVLLALALLGGIGRALMPWAVRAYVNRTLDRSPLYDGQIGDVRVHLWRGAYSIQDIRINKTTGNVPVPLFAAKNVDFAMQWNALAQGRLVGRVVMERPELNFVDAGGGNAQTGAGGPWLQMIRDLFPFQINRTIIKDGAIHFHAFQERTPVNVYLSEVYATIDNLGNIRDETTPLFCTVRARGLAMDQAKFELNMTLDAFSYRPTFQLAARILGLDVTKINDLARTYGKFDFKHGWFDFVIQADAKEGRLEGYAKPLFRDLEVFSLAEDAENPIKLFWQALVGATTSLFKNPRRDQLGTLIPFSGDLTGSTSADILATLGNLFRNAFVRAYLPRLESVGSNPELQFEPPDFSEKLAAEDSL